MNRLILMFVFVMLCIMTNAQQKYTISTDNPVKISVKGNSTLHEWEAVASEVIDYPTELSTTSTGDIDFENFEFKVGVASLDGGRGASMNKKIKKALQAPDHPYIIYKFSDFTILEDNIENNQMVKSTGALQIAGETMDAEVEANVALADDRLIITGAKALKMSDFGIEPPSAMFGQIQTRDDITVNFEFRYIKK